MNEAQLKQLVAVVRKLAIFWGLVPAVLQRLLHICRLERSEAGLQVYNYLAYDTRGVPPTVALSANFSFNGVEEGKAARLTASVTDDVQVRNSLRFSSLCGEKTVSARVSTII
jgi:hypothetical protein